MQKAGCINSVGEPEGEVSNWVKLDSQPEPKVICRNGFLVAAGAVAIFAGIALPLPRYILDVLLIFSISLTVAVLLIVFSARQITQVQGFPLFLVLITAFRMALSVASGKMILSAGNAGTITGFFGNLIVRIDFVPSILIFGLVAVIIFAVLCKFIRDIIRSGAEFNNTVLRYKKGVIDDELNCGLINDRQAEQRRRKTAFESCFFTAMVGAAQFMLFAAAIELVVIIFNIVGGLAAGTSASSNAENSTKTYIVLAVGSGMIAYISYLFTVLASRYLVRNSRIAPSGAPFGAAEINKGFDFSQNRRTVNSSEVQTEGKQSARGNDLDNKNFKTILLESQETVENPEADGQGVFAEFTPLDDFSYQKASADISDVEESEQDRQVSLSGESSEAKRRPERNELESDTAGEAPDKNEPDYQGEDCYRRITNLILEKRRDKQDEATTILMAAENVSSLPVTLPVNIAVRLAQKGCNCLLMDLDLDRNAVAEVFDINQTGPDGQSLDNGDIVFQSCVENLCVFPAVNFGPPRRIVSRGLRAVLDVISDLKSRFEFLIIYAPNIGNTVFSGDSLNPSAGIHINHQPGRKASSRKGHLTAFSGIAGVVDSAILFGGSEQRKACRPVVGTPDGEAGKGQKDILTKFRDLLSENSCEVIDSADVLAGSV